jgi:RNase P subunit RPR2
MSFQSRTLDQKAKNTNTILVRLAVIANCEDLNHTLSHRIMTTDAVELRLNFLKQAARHLAVPSPTVAATMGTAHTNILVAEDQDVSTSRKDWDALRRGICGSCGNAMLPGWSCKVSYRSQPMKKSKLSPKPSSKPEKQLVYSCSRCDRKTVQALPSRPPKHIESRLRTNDNKQSQAIPTEMLAVEDSRVSKSVNATSKQRKKARKGGLQAMLDKNKSNKATQGGLGLDLMDFMQ